MTSTLRFRSVIAFGLLALAGCHRGGDAQENSQQQKEATSSSHAQALTNVPMAAAAGSSQQVCQDTDLAACATGGAMSDSCLTLYVACGRYMDIIAYYRTQQGSSTRDWYYIGVAYHGLYLRNRAAAARCQFGSAARFALQKYINDSTVDVTDLNDQRTFQQTYHATKLLKSVHDIPGCADNGVTYDELYGATLQHGKEVVEGLFLGDPPPGVAADVNTTKANMQAAIRGFISNAAAIETEVGLLRAAMDQSDTRILSSFQILQNGFGATGGESDTGGAKPVISSLTAPDGTSAFGKYQVLYAGYLQQATDMQNQLTSAMKTASISDYEKARVTLVTDARNQVATSAALITRAAITDQTVVGDVQSKTSALRNADNGSAAFLTIKAKWNAYGKRSGKCNQASPPWYCQ